MQNLIEKLGRSHYCNPRHLPSNSQLRGHIINPPPPPPASLLVIKLIAAPRPLQFRGGVYDGTDQKDLGEVIR